MNCVEFTENITCAQKKVEFWDCRMRSSRNVDGLRGVSLGWDSSWQQAPLDKRSVLSILFDHTRIL